MQQLQRSSIIKERAIIRNNAGIVNKSDEFERKANYLPNPIPQFFPFT